MLNVWFHFQVWHLTWNLAWWSNILCYRKGMIRKWNQIGCRGDLKVFWCWVASGVKLILRVKPMQTPTMMPQPKSSVRCHCRNTPLDPHAPKKSKTILLKCYSSSSINPLCFFLSFQLLKQKTEKYSPYHDDLTTQKWMERPPLKGRQTTKCFSVSNVSMYKYDHILISSN